MSTEILRRAAALMRERAEGATRGPWVVDVVDDGVDVRGRRGAGPTVASTVPLGYERRRVNAAHIASWHPDVALAVADWLDSTANDVEHVHTPVYNLTSTTVARALAVARAYLGESA